MKQMYQGPKENRKWATKKGVTKKVVQLGLLAWMFKRGKTSKRNKTATKASTRRTNKHQQGPGLVRKALRLAIVIVGLKRLWTK